MGKERLSNMELLRIVSMFLIVLHHYCVHGPWSIDGSVTWSVVVGMLGFGGKLGVDCFVLTTGYFMISSKFKSRSILRIILETWFYAYLIGAVFLFGIPDHFQQDYFARFYLPIISGEYWFVTTYIGLMLFSPALNKLFNSLENTGRNALIIILVIVFALLPTITKLPFVMSNLVWFIALYFVGAYAKLSKEEPLANRTGITWLNPVEVCNRIRPAVVAIVSFCIMALLTLLFEYARIKHGIELAPRIYLLDQNSILMLYMAVGIFLCFERINCGSIKLINLLASAVFGVYLIHDNPLVRAYLWPHFAFAQTLGVIPFVFIGLAAAVGVFLICSLFDFARQHLLEKPFFALTDKAMRTKYQSIDEWFMLMG